MCKTNAPAAELPPELLRQLKKPKKTAMVLDIIKEAGGASLDHILIQLYRQHRLIMKRTALTNMLWRMSKEGAVSIPMRGIYERHD